MEGKEPNTETIKNTMLKLNEHALPKRILTFSPEGTKRG
jgi:hypothetical protein